MKSLQGNFQLGNLAILNFQALNSKDQAVVREMRNNRLVRKWMYSKGVISRQEHRRVLSGRKNRRNDFYWRVKTGRDCIGVVYLNRMDQENKHAYLGIYANPSLDIKGKGALLMQCLKYVGFVKAGLHTIKL